MEWCNLRRGFFWGYLCACVCVCERSPWDALHTVSVWEKDRHGTFLLPFSICIVNFLMRKKRDSKKRNMNWLEPGLFVKFTPDEKGETHNTWYAHDLSTFCRQCPVVQPAETLLAVLSHLYLFWFGSGLRCSYSNRFREADFLFSSIPIMLWFP